MYRKLSIMFVVLAMLVIPASASAHVVVTPTEIAVARSQTFTINVPNDNPTLAITGLKLTIPLGLSEVLPTVQSGWHVDITTAGDKVSELSWSGGLIPAGQRGDFTFAAQAPARVTSLNWKAYETYEDGTVESWDQIPTGKDSQNSKPYSVTKVISDIAPSGSDATSSSETSSNNNILAVIFGLLAIIISVGGVLIRKTS